MSETLSASRVHELYEEAAKDKTSIATADAIIGTPDTPYSPAPDNRIKGKSVKELMVSLGWEYRGEIAKVINGIRTTVGIYTKR